MFIVLEGILCFTLGYISYGYISHGSITLLNKFNSFDIVKKINKLIYARNDESIE